MAHACPFTAPATPLVLTFQQAQERLATLTPGSEEYRQLQAALSKTATIAEVHLSHMSYKISTFSDGCRLLGGFGSSEHMEIGFHVALQGLPAKTPLLDNTQIEFHHIVALAGDFYGIPGEAIALPGGTSEEKTARFHNSFNTLAQANPDELRQILVELNQEWTAVKHHNLPHHCYSSHMMERNSALSKIKDTSALLIDNSDHFSTNAEEAYFIGHQLALRMAREAGRINDLEGLKRAYALEAFACHFLTDLFASGHIRNQRGPLETFLITKLEFSPDHAKKLAGLLTGAQHEKDGNEGLNVANHRGDHWRAFGDGKFFTDKNRENREKAIATTQLAVDEVYRAYRSPDSTEPTTIGELIPHAIPFNPLPIYSIDGEGSLFVYQNNRPVPIRTKMEYINIAIMQEALRHLPEGYINGYINQYLPTFQIPPLVGKMIIPRWENFTGTIWHMVGVATYYQARQETAKLNEKLDEIAGSVLSANDGIVEILAQMKVVCSQLNHVVFVQNCEQMQEHIGRIKDIQNQKRIHSGPLSEAAEERLLESYNRLSRLVHDGTVDGQNILEIYKHHLEQASPPLSSPEVLIKVTLWFRQMLDCQKEALYLYTLSQFERNTIQQEAIRIRVAEFEISLSQQIENNKAYIDERLIYESSTYIRSQLENHKTRQLAKALLHRVAGDQT